jgi:hypothetical protein
VLWLACARGGAGGRRRRYFAREGGGEKNHGGISGKYHGGEILKITAKGAKDATEKVKLKNSRSAGHGVIGKYDGSNFIFAPFALLTLIIIFLRMISL